MRFQQIIPFLGMAAVSAVLVGLLVRRRYRVLYFFTVYTACVLVADSLVLLWRDRFFTWDFWLQREMALAVLKFAIGLEVAARAFKAFPTAQANARRVLFLVLALTWVAVVNAPVATQSTAPSAVLTADEDFKRLLFEAFLPRIQNGTAWLFTAILAIVLWYRLPLNLFRKAVLIGFVPFLLASTIANQLGTAEATKGYAQLLESLAFLGVQLYWARAAWRSAPDIVVTPAAAASHSPLERLASGASKSG